VTAIVDRATRPLGVRRVKVIRRQHPDIPCYPYYAHAGHGEGPRPMWPWACVADTIRRVLAPLRAGAREAHSLRTDGQRPRSALSLVLLMLLLVALKGASPHVGLNQTLSRGRCRGSKRSWLSDETSGFTVSHGV
jgi:hypothetical protein